MQVRTDFIPVTPASIYANITLQFDTKDLQFLEKDGASKATVNLYGRITTMSRRVVKVFEDVVSVEGDFPAFVGVSADHTASSRPVSLEHRRQGCHRRKYHHL